MLIWSVMTLFVQASGLSFTQIGIMSSAGALVSLVVEVPSGWLADRWGRRRTRPKMLADAAGSQLSAATASSSPRPCSAR